MINHVNKSMCKSFQISKPAVNGWDIIVLGVAGLVIELSKLELMCVEVIHLFRVIRIYFSRSTHIKI